MHLGTASSVDAPSFRVITQLLHDFVQAVADSGRRCRAPIADLWLLTDIKLH